MQNSWRDQDEWLETDGLGGFATGTVGGIRTRRYHALLNSATTPPTGRFTLVNGVEVSVTTPAGDFPLTSERYVGQVVAPDGFKFVETFDTEPWPTWRYRLPDGTIIEHELFMPHGQPSVVMSWRLVSGAGKTRLCVRPLISGRDYHALHHENGTYRFDAEQHGATIRWRPYNGVPAIHAVTNGNYVHRPLWYRHFLYQEEWLRGFDATEDLASPGTFDFDLSSGEAQVVLTAHTDEPIQHRPFAALRATEAKRRSAMPSPLHRAADQYLVRRDGGKTIIAGYPWFADWGRDTFISLRGLCLATQRLEDAKQILLSWTAHVSAGMLPNRFPDVGSEPEYNSVDASLWFVICVCEFLKAAGAAELHVAQHDRCQLLAAVDAILTGYAAGTRHGIKLDVDGLLSAGEPGVQLTWMDARIGDHVVTPRIGKPVELQALWLNATWLASSHFPRWEAVGARGAASFRARFWNQSGRYLHDVVDDHHRPGVNDDRFRPNQIFAVGGLPLMLIGLDQVREIVDAVEKRLWTPLGLRSLAPTENGYCPRYIGGPSERDAAYHQGTVWPWLIGAFVEAWVRVRGSTDTARREARHRFVDPILKHLDQAGLGHVSEIADGEAPHMPRGCPFQAWSIAELLRLEQNVLATEGAYPAATSVHPTRVNHS